MPGHSTASLSCSTSFSASITPTATTTPLNIPVLPRTKSQRRPRSKNPSSRSASPLNSQIPRTSLYTYASNSSLASLYSAHASSPYRCRRSPAGSRSSSRSPEPHIYTAVMAPMASLPPCGPLPPTPPLGSLDAVLLPLPSTLDSDEEVEEIRGRRGNGDDDDDDDDDNNNTTSPPLSSSKRPLRRVRGSISAGSSSEPPSPTSPTVIISGMDIALGVGEVGVGTPPITPPKEVLLHHPKPLRRSPKSEYFRDSLKNISSSGGGGNGRFSMIDLDSSGEEAAGAPRPDSPLEGERGGGGFIFDDDDDGEDEDDDEGGVRFEDPVEVERGGKETERIPEHLLVLGKPRIFGKAGKKVTPWPTPRLRSYEASSSVPNDDDDEEEEVEVEVEDELQVVPEKDSVVVVDDEKKQQKETPLLQTVTEPVIPKPDLAKLATMDIEDTQPSLTTLTSTQPPSTTPTPTPQPPEISPATPPPEAAPGAEAEAEDEEAKDQIILLLPPPSSTSSLYSPQPETTTPIFNLIPATPLPLSTTAMLEKQLGHPASPESASLTIPTQTLTSTPTPGLTLQSPTFPLSPAQKNAKKRPSLRDQPKRLRESKLHPWWRPRGGIDEEEAELARRMQQQNREGGGLTRTLSSESHFSDAAAPPTHRHSWELRRINTAPAPAGRGGGGGGKGKRVTKRIAGTRLQIEFFGIGGVVGVLGKLKGWGASGAAAGKEKKAAAVVGGEEKKEKVKGGKTGGKGGDGGVDCIKMRRKK